MCDKIAAEILMSRKAFWEDSTKLGWSLSTIKALSEQYLTSVPATAIRMVDLMPEPCLLGVWKPPTDEKDAPKLDWCYSQNSRFGLPNNLPRSQLWLIPRAANSQGIQVGVAPVIDKKRPRRIPNNVPAEALARGAGKYRKVMVYYYPDRPLPQTL